MTGTLGAAPPLVELASVTKAFGRDAAVVEELSLTIPAGGFVALIGPSGCGKSTLLNLLAGLTEVSGGDVRIQPGARLAYVFQRPRLLPWRSVVGNVAYGLEQLPGMPSAEVQARAAAALALVGLAGQERRYPHQLSGGMQQRVAVARALAVEPDVLLLDEPFGALDAITRGELQDELATLVRRRDTTALLVTHDIDEALLLADRVVVMSGRPGRVRAQLPVPFADRVTSLDQLVAEPGYPALRTQLRSLLRPEG